MNQILGLLLVLACCQFSQAYDFGWVPQSHDFYDDPWSRPGYGYHPESYRNNFHDDMRSDRDYYPNPSSQVFHDDRSSAVAFSASTELPHSGPAMRKLRFKNTISNEGYSWNPRTNEFVCRQPGLYFFTFSVQSSSSKDFRLSLRHNNKPVVMSWGSAGEHQTKSNTAILRLNPNDRVYLQLEEKNSFETGEYRRNGHVSFNGFKIQSTMYYNDRVNSWDNTDYHRMKPNCPVIKKEPEQPHVQQETIKSNGTSQHSAYENVTDSSFKIP